MPSLSRSVDNAVGTYSANKAIVDADEASVRRYAALVSFEKVYAPFDGVITARNTDIGDLINSGSSTAPRTDHVSHGAGGHVARIRECAGGILAGSESWGRPRQTSCLPEFPGKRFPGKLVRTADAINATTRTLLVEVDVPNPPELFSPARTPKCT